MTGTSRDLVDSTPPRAADFAARLKEAEAELTAAVSRQAQLAAIRPDLLLSGNDDDLDAHDAESRLVARRAERFGALIGKLQGDLAAAEYAEDQASRRVTFDAARAASKAGQDSAAKSYRRAITEVRAAIRALAEAGVKVNEANASLPDGEAPLADPETELRGRMYVPQREVSRRQVALWLKPGSREPYPPEFQDKIRLEQGGKTGFLPGSHGPTMGIERSEDYDEVQYAPAENSVYPDSLAAAVNLPSLLPSDRAGWVPLDGMASPSRVLAILSLGDEPQSVPARPRSLIMEYVRRPTPGVTPAPRFQPLAVVQTIPRSSFFQAGGPS